MELKYSVYFSIFFFGVLTIIYAEVLNHRVTRTIWLDKIGEVDKDEGFMPDSLNNTHDKSTMIEVPIFMHQDGETKGHERPNKNVEDMLRERDLKNKKDVLQQKLIRDKDSVKEKITENRKISQDKSSFHQDVLLEFGKKYCASRYQTSDLQECLLLCNLQQISRENFRDLTPFPPQKPNIVSQEIFKDGILTQNDDEDIYKKEIPETSTQNKEIPETSIQNKEIPETSSQNKEIPEIKTQNKEIPETSTQNKDSFPKFQQLLQEHDISAKVAPTETRYPTKYFKRSQR